MSAATGVQPLQPGALNVKDMTSIFDRLCGAHMKRIEVKSKTLREQPAQEAVAQLLTQLAQQLGDADVAEDAAADVAPAKVQVKELHLSDRQQLVRHGLSLLLQQDHVHVSYMTMPGVTLEEAGAILLAELQLLGTAAGSKPVKRQAPGPTDRDGVEAPAPDKPRTAVSALAQQASSRGGAASEVPHKKARLMPVWQSSLPSYSPRPGLDLPPLPGPLPEWVTDLPDLAVWLQRNADHLRFVARASPLPADKFWEQQELCQVLPYMITGIELAADKSKADGSSSSSGTGTQAFHTMSAAGTYLAAAAAAAAAKPAPDGRLAPRLRPLGLHDWQTRSSYTKLVDLLRESADMFPHLFGPEEVPVPTFMVGRRSKLSFALTGEPIGGGGYGSVYGLDLCNGKQLAVKVLHDAVCARDFVTEHHLLLSSALTRMRHVMPLATLGVVRMAGWPFKFMPALAMPLGSCNLNQLVCQAADTKEPPWGQQHPELLQEYMYQAAVGLYELHAYGIIHKDVKPENLIHFKAVDGVGPGTVRIADLGIAELGTPGKELSGRCTTYYAAPEVLGDAAQRRSACGYMADIWSWGATLLHLAAGQHPWAALFGEDGAAVEGILSLLTHSSPQTCLERCPGLAWFQEQQPAGWEALVAALQYKPADRPDADQLLAMPWFLQQRQAALEAADAEAQLDRGGAALLAVHGSATRDRSPRTEAPSTQSAVAQPTGSAVCSEAAAHQPVEQHRDEQQQDASAAAMSTDTEKQCRPSRQQQQEEVIKHDLPEQEHVPAYHYLLSGWRSGGRCPHQRWVGSCCLCHLVCCG